MIAPVFLSTRSVCVCLILVVCLLRVTAAIAQGTEQPVAPGGTTFDPRRDAQMRVGPLYLTPAFRLTNLGVDTNVFNSASDSKSDFGATLSPRVDTWLPIARRALVSLAFAPDFVYFSTFASERSIDPRLDVRADVYARRVTLFVGDGFLRSRQRPTLEIDARSQRRENELQAGFAVQLSRRISVQVAAYDRVLAYDQDALFFGTSLRQALDHDERGVEWQVRDKLTTKTTMVLKGQTFRDRFNFSPFRDADGFRVTPAVEFSPRALIAGAAEVGLRRLTSSDSSVLDYTGVVGAASLSYSLLGSNTFGVTWNRDIGYSYEPGEADHLSDGVGGTIRRQLAGSYDAILGADRHAYGYRSLGTASTLAAVRRDVTVTYSLDVGYRVNRRSRVGVVLSKYTRTSNTIGIHDYRGLRAGLSVTYGH